jgi:hypothetical protein
MSVFFSDGSVMSAPPRLIAAYDTVAGCPPGAAARNNSFALIVSTVTIARPASIFLNAKTICSGTGRHDRGLSIVGPSGSGFTGAITSRLDYKFGTWWDDAFIHWAGVFPVAGTYTVTFTNNSGVYVCGCGSSYGRMNIIIMEN